MSLRCLTVEYGLSVARVKLLDTEEDIQPEYLTRLTDGLAQKF